MAIGHMKWTRVTQRLQAPSRLPCDPQGQLCAAAFVLHVLDVDWLLSAAVYCVTAEPRCHNARTEASHAPRQQDRSEHQWLACIQLAQLLLDWQFCFLVFSSDSLYF